MCDITYPGMNFAPQGWQCPICKRVYSPDTPMCLTCGNQETYTTTDTKIRTGNPTPDMVKTVCNNFKDIVGSFDVNNNKDG